MLCATSFRDGNVSIDIVDRIQRLGTLQIFLGFEIKLRMNDNPCVRVMIEHKLNRRLLTPSYFALGNYKVKKTMRRLGFFDPCSQPLQGHNSEEKRGVLVKQALFWDSIPERGPSTTEGRQLLPGSVTWEGRRGHVVAQVKNNCFKSLSLRDAGILGPQTASQNNNPGNAQVTPGNTPGNTR